MYTQYTNHANRYIYIWKSVPSVCERSKEWQSSRWDNMSTCVQILRYQRYSTKWHHVSLQGPLSWGSTYLNESPMFLALKGRNKEARTVVESMGRQEIDGLEDLEACLPHQQPSPPAVSRDMRSTGPQAKQDPARYLGLWEADGRSERGVLDVADVQTNELGLQCGVYSRTPSAAHNWRRTCFSKICYDVFDLDKGSITSQLLPWGFYYSDHVGMFYTQYGILWEPFCLPTGAGTRVNQKASCWPLFNRSSNYMQPMPNPCRCHDWDMLKAMQTSQIVYYDLYVYSL